MKKIAIFASGSGTNAENIMQYFSGHPSIKVELVLSNKSNAQVLERAKRFNVETFVFDRHQFYETQVIQYLLIKHQVDFIVLAGFLWLVPSSLISDYSGHIVNIHPALLPRHGGKGCYGMHVHEAVINSHDTETGITIHFVNEEYDSGSVIFQAKCPVEPGDSAETVAQKVHALEYEYFPTVIEKVIEKQ
jgi:phosphoribosylglycinamide formyltransferase 1